MAAPTTLPALLASLTQSLSLTQEAAPKIATIDHPKDGISLLDVKNELLLSYLQNLVFLILLKLRNAKSDSEDSSELDESVRAKLVQLRLYLEKGARPLEEKLKFSIERFLRTAQDSQREEKSKEQQSKSKSDENSDDESASDEEESGEDGNLQGRLPIRKGNMAAAPNLGTMVDEVSVSRGDREDGPAGIYRPPKRDRALMDSARPREKAERRAQKSFTMEEFVNDEFSTAPMAEPSIGTTIVQGGRKMKTAAERKDEDERREYEETNFTRLPKESKKERAKKAKAAGHSGRMQFGGEEWHNLGEGVDRIDRLTKRKGPPGGGVRAMLEKSRKRGFDTTDGPRGSGRGVEMGDRFQKKAKMLERKERGKNR
ncbi:Sas10/Utp3/C1D-like protein [Pochonia chlamydosporia 170]|uniref:Sas10/Utp3/C1D-like protein n=1 Tax=Pochonia chlamydosporia 170 TaxID=1380566 RepID=A0A179FUX6_METCM|nr:Sas10/Utp3/C1D-like protein [Pochonia chlamydosporia 170]OAQ68799.1 Sas10/Utp3/C1D-like protein [Pochonia chlamydosporia 170]